MSSVFDAVRKSISGAAVEAAKNAADVAAKNAAFDIRTSPVNEIVPLGNRTPDVKLSGKKKAPGVLVKKDDGTWEDSGEEIDMSPESMEAANNQRLQDEAETAEPEFDPTWGHQMKQDQGFNLGNWAVAHGIEDRGGRVEDPDETPMGFSLGEEYVSMNDIDTTKEQNAYRDYFMKQGYNPDDDTFVGIGGLGNRYTQDDLDHMNDVPYDPVLMSTMSQLPIDQQYQAAYTQNEDNAALKIAGKGIDDGTMHPENLTSDTMTGEQYIKYAQMGMGGRDIDDIDPNKTYSKSDEYQNYGFIPYIPDDDAWMKMVRQRAEEDPARFFNNIGGARQNQHWDMTVDGETYDGKDVFDNIWKWGNDAERLDEEEYKAYSEIYDSANARTDATAYALDTYLVSMNDGSQIEVPAKVESAQRVSPGSEAIEVTFGDGNRIIFENDEDMNASIVPNKIRKAVDGDAIAQYLPNDLVLDNGQSLTSDQIMRILADNGQGNDSGLSYDFGFWNWKRPTFLQNEERKADYLDMANLPGNVYDLMAGSLPYFFTATPAGLVTTLPNALSRADIASRNVDPSSIGPDGTGHINHENLTEDEYLAGILGELATPLTELGPGLIGKSAIGGLPFVKKLAEKFKGKNESKGWYDVAELGKGIAGEGLEEIPGNFVEEYTAYGSEGMLGDVAYDENGKKMKTPWGEGVRVKNDDLSDRMENFFGEAPNAALGGALMGTAFSLLPPFKGARAVGRSVQKTKRNREARRNGGRPYEQVYENDREIGIGDDLESYFERLERERGINGN